MPTTTKVGVCPECRLEVDLTRGTIKNHPAPNGTGALCAGSKSKPASIVDEHRVEPSPVANPDVTPTLDHAALEAAPRPAGAWSGAEAIVLDPAICDPDPNNPRADLGDLDELALSLVAQGMLEPVIVTPGPTDGRYTIVAGHRRIAAAIMANLTEIPALVRADLTPGSNLSLVAQVVENLHRLDLTPLDEARAYDLLRQLGLKQTDIATRVGVNQGQVSKRLALLKLPDDLAAKVNTGTVDVATAVEITRLPANIRKNVASQIDRGADPESAVRSARRTADRDAEHQALIDQLETDQVALVDFPSSYHWGRDREDRPLATGTNGDPQPYRGARTLDITYTDHANQPCHGAAVSPRDEIIYVCLDPTRHGYPTAEQENAAADAERQARLEADEADRAAALAIVQARRDAARELATGKIERPYMTDVLAAWTVDTLAVPFYTEVAPDPTEIVDVILGWTPDLDPDTDDAHAVRAETIDDDELLTRQVARLSDHHGPLRLAYMAAIAGAELLVDSPSYTRNLLAGGPIYRDHFARLTEIAGYEPTPADLALIAPAADVDVVELPGDEPPAGAVAWYVPTVDATLEGDEPRWLYDPAEADAIRDAGIGGRIIMLEIEPSANPRSTEGENTTTPADEFEVGDADPGAGPIDDVDDADRAAADAAHEAAETPPVDPGDTPTPGERCPASRRDFNTPGNADGIPCPLKCGATVSTTNTGRVRDHDVPEPVV